MRHLAGATAVLILAAASPAAGQVLRGQVLDAATDRGVSSADVSLLDTLGVRRASVLTDSSGAFRVKVNAAGVYRVRVERLGYRATQIDSIDIGDSEEVVVVLRVGVAYESDLDKVERAFLEEAGQAVAAVPGALSEPSPQVRFESFGESAIEVMVIVRVMDFRDRVPVAHELIKRLKARCEKEGIEIPPPRRALSGEIRVAQSPP